MLTNTLLDENLYKSALPPLLLVNLPFSTLQNSSNVFALTAVDWSSEFMLISK